MQTIKSKGNTLYGSRLLLKDILISLMQEKQNLMQGILMKFNAKKQPINECTYHPWTWNQVVHFHVSSNELFFLQF